MPRISQAGRLGRAVETDQRRVSDQFDKTRFGCHDASRPRRKRRTLSRNSHQCHDLRRAGCGQHLNSRRDSPGLSGIKWDKWDSAPAPERSRARNQESRTPGSREPERSRARNRVVRAAHRISRDSHDAERAGWGRARPKARALLRCIARLCARLGARCIAPWSGSRTPESREPERSRARNMVVRAERASLSAVGCPARVTAFDPVLQTVEAAHHERTRRRPGGTL